jgi:hypothetical protein
MLKNYGHEVWLLCKMFYELEKLLNQFTYDLKSNPQAYAEFIQSGGLEELKRFTNEKLINTKILLEDAGSKFIAGHRMESVHAEIRRIVKLQEGSASQEAIVAELNALRNRIEDELESVKFIAIDSAKELYFTNERPFGDNVSCTFPCVSYDIEEASKCLALERSTASAFHSIRALEAAIRAISRCLRIPDPTRAADRNWGAMLKKINAEIDRRWSGSSNRMSGDGEFFDNAFAALAAMQNPYRNSTMHLDQKYTSEEASHIFEVVGGFMKKLASRMDEDGLPLA